MNDAALFDRTFVVSARTVARASPEKSGEIIRFLGVGEALPGHMVRGHSIAGVADWARVKLASGAVGYVWTGYGTWTED